MGGSGASGDAPRHTLDSIAATTASSGLASTELQEEAIEPDVIVMRPALWTTIEAEASDAFASNDNQPAAADAMARRLYGVPVVVTNSATRARPGSDLRGSARIFRTGGASVTIHDSAPRSSGEAPWPTIG